eukprot:TRINITY_DN6763_c0_g1_i1.p1 TRINITY_DN6763_c0_g1~~TRINITY_DN6763_c0_g1_i1.p1  ORF type:complete len:270 (+),score=40.52 TRINITY_DN6763_c0_g1_i1:110-919(+)
MASVRLVSFDATGTLLRLNEPVGRLYKRFASEKGWSCEWLSEQALEQSFFKAFKEQNKGKPNFGLPHLTPKEWWRTVTHNTFAYSLPPNAGMSLFGKVHYDSVFEHLYSQFATRAAWSLLPGALPVLQFLKQSEIETFIVSNTDSRLHQLLKELGVEEYFTCVLLSCEVGSSKPDVGIFREILKRRPLLSPQHIIHIGDSYFNDYLPPRSIGMESVLIQPRDIPPTPTSVAFSSALVNGEGQSTPPPVILEYLTQLIPLLQHRTALSKV